MKVANVCMLNIPDREPALLVRFAHSFDVCLNDELYEPCEEGPPIWFRVDGISFGKWWWNTSVLLRPQRNLEEGTILTLRKRMA